jgi:hypothetical protein
MGSASAATAARDAAFVKEKYESQWSGIEESLQRIAAEEGPNLARILNRALDYESQVPNVFQDRYRRRFPPLLGDRPIAPSISRRARRFLREEVIIDTLLRHCGPAVERVVELGSGWGTNLASLWLHGAPCDAEYHAFEYTAAGRRCAETLGAAEPAFRLKATPFNYYEPDFSAFAERKRTFVYSCSSIEQITELPERTLEAILAIPGLERVVHFEPVGWQLPQNALRRQLDELLSGLPKKVRTIHSAEIRKYARRHKYNRNLWPLLRRFEAAGRLKIEDAQRHILGINPFNPTTLIVWRPS